MRLWDVDVKPRGVSRPRGLSLNGGLAKADLSLARCSSGMLHETTGTVLSITPYLSVNIVRHFFEQNIQSLSN
jgi:hypothetical protein